MDRDTDPDDPTEEVRETKARIRDEALKDPHHRLALFSLGREIENDVDPHVFCNAVSKLLKVERERLSGLKLSGARRYPDEIIAHLSLDEETAKKTRRRLKDKVALAEIVAAEWTDEAMIPPYVDELVKLVERSRLV